MMFTKSFSVVLLALFLAGCAARQHESPPMAFADDASTPFVPQQAW